MAAYSAVISLEQILKQSTDYFPKDQLDSLLLNVSSLKSSIEKIFPAPKNDRNTANKLGIQIRDAVYKAQDSIESFIYTKTHQTQPPETLSLPEIAADMGPIILEAEALAATIGEYKKYPDPVEEYVSYRPSMRGVRTRVVGQEKDKELLTAQLWSDVDKREVIPITGMPGVGKTTLAKSIFEDKFIMDKFPYRAWVTVSQDYEFADILRELLTSVESRGQKGGEMVYEGTELSLREKLHQKLYNNKYLVVVDDMWDTVMWNKLQLSLPDNENGSRVLLTTRIKDVAEAVMTSTFCHRMKPLNEEDSWALLCEKTFGDALCPTHLEKIGKKIAKNCGGLPLTIGMIGGFLSGERKTEEYWRSIAEETNDAPENLMIEEPYSKSILLSYDHLPSNLKACFLYMAAFPRDTDIHVSKLVKLWVAEGFLTPPLPWETIERVAENALVQLADRNLILISKNSSTGGIKTFRMHAILLGLARREAENGNFFYSITPQTENFYSSTDRRRISVHKTDLMCRKQVYESAKLIKLARTLLYVDPTYPYPIPFYLAFHLLRVFDAFNVFFIEFPHEVIRLIHLRYLSFTYNGKLPPSISQLKNLQILMVRRGYKIIFMGVSFLPDEIWNMSQLRHLQFAESDLPLPPVVENTPLFANLQSLSNVNAYSCTKEVLQNMPNLKKLEMWIEAPGNVEFHVGVLKQLESFKFTVLEPSRRSRIYFEPKLSFPETLRKLSMSGCGLPWDDMKVIGRLPNIEVLKLRELAFNGDEWCPDYVFHKLKFLMIEYLNLQRLNTDGTHFPRIEQLIFRHCYELANTAEWNGIPKEIGELGYLELIELVDCSLDAVDAAEDIKDEQAAFGNERLQVRIYI